MKKGSLMNQSRLNLTFGIWCSWIGIALALAYLAALAAAAISPSGFPPVEPYDSAISVVCLLSAPVILILFALNHTYASEERKLFSLIGLCFAVLFCAMTCINRFVHLAVVRPSLAIGKTDGLEWFMPYGSPSVMGAIEILAWSFFLGLAFTFTAFAFDKTRLERRLFWICLVNGLLCLVSTLTPLTGIVLFTFLGIPAWGPGFILFCALLMALFKDQLLGSKAHKTTRKSKAWTESDARV
jgi:hypothetical protein